MRGSWDAGDHVVRQRWARQFVDKLAAKRAEIRRLQRITAAYREHADLGFDAAQLERKIQQIELAAAGLEQSILELRGRDVAQQIEYEQGVARLAAEGADVRTEAFLRVPMSGRVVTVHRAVGRRVLFGRAPVDSSAQ